MRQLRFNYAFPTGYVQPYPLIPGGSLLFPALYGLSVAQSPTDAEFAALTLIDQASLPYNITFPDGMGKYLVIGVPAQLGVIDTFIFNGFPIRFISIPSNDQDAINSTGTAVGEPYFLYIQGVQYAFNFYVSQYVQHGTNITITVPVQ